MFSRFFIERPIFAAVIVDHHRAGRAGVAEDPADRAIPRDRAADGEHHRHLSGRDAPRRWPRRWPRRSRSSSPASRTCSTSTPARRRTAQTTITATFDVGTDIDKATFNVNNRVQLATAAPARRGAAQRRDVPKRSNNFLLVDRAQLAEEQLRHPVPVELRDAEPRRRAEARAGRRPTCRSSARATTRCASGCSPTRWRGSASRPATSPRR